MKSLIFSGPMVRAYMDGLKTMTRRPQGLERVNQEPDLWKYGGMNKFGQAIFYPIYEDSYTDDFDGLIKPRFLPGETVYVKETWQECYTIPKHETEIIYRADNPTSTEPIKWKSPLFLKEVDSRIKLKILTVGAEKLWDISRKDAHAEGFHPSPYNGLESFGGKSYGNANLAFKACWDTLYAKKPEYQWEQNIWIFKYGFEGIKS